LAQGRALPNAESAPQANAMLISPVRQQRGSHVDAKGEMFYRRLLDNQRTALLLLDSDLNISYLNAAAEALLSSSRQRLLSLPLASCFCDSTVVATALHACLQNGHPFTCREVELRDVHIRDHKGHAQLVDYSVTRLEGDTGEGALLIEMQPVDQLLRMSREEGWQQAHLAMRQLVRGVAHELKNPLGGIRGSAQLLLSALPGSEWQEYLDVIIDESDRLCELADRMLGVKRAPAMQAVNVHECLERVRQLVQGEQPELTVLRDYDPSLPEVPADRNQLVQALLNLVRNAMQALQESNVPDGHILLRTRALRQFTISARRHRLVMCIDVEDNGPGVPEALRDALFFPLVTGRAQGMGLGLAIAQDIVSQHHGLIECESRPGHTRFSVLLPMEQIFAEPSLQGSAENDSHA
jgi:two-component system nitrogen regulation sensor histidine kinase GlnL